MWLIAYCNLLQAITISLTSDKLQLFKLFGLSYCSLRLLYSSSRNNVTVCNNGNSHIIWFEAQKLYIQTS